MKLRSVTQHIQRFPDGGSSRNVHLRFRKGKKDVDKCIKVTASSGDDISAETKYLILLKAREAERDFAFMKHGDKWRDHVPMRTFWETSMTDREHELVEDAVQLMRDING